MSKPIDECPACGGRHLIAVCRTTVEYDVTNEEGGCDQDWSRRQIDDDTSEPQSFRCGSCGAEFGQFKLNEDGYLVHLSPAECSSQQ
jgi:DNA-directed RNA polymerase subunit RPC12/RpoP